MSEQEELYPKRFVDEVYKHAGRLFRVVAIMQPKCPLCPETLQVLYLDDNSKGVIDNSRLIESTTIA